MSLFSQIQKLRKDQKGATLVEFAIIAPSFMLLLMGTFDIGYTVFLRATFSGAVLDAARDSTLETAPASQSSIDAEITRRMQTINSSSSLSFSRQSYFDFADVARPEAVINDVDSDGECDTGDSFEDENGNGTWDADLGASGIGGPNDVVLYTVTLTYDRIFPLYGLLGQSQSNSMDLTTVLRNQPYGIQSGRDLVSVEPCP
jgi:Flp pilus assembly pilin Flp